MGQMSIRYAKRPEKPPSGFTPRVLLLAALLVAAFGVVRLLHG